LKKNGGASSRNWRVRGGGRTGSGKRGYTQSSSREGIGKEGVQKGSNWGSPGKQVIRGEGGGVKGKDICSMGQLKKHDRGGKTKFCNHEGGGKNKKRKRKFVGRHQTRVGKLHVVGQKRRARAKGEEGSCFEGEGIGEVVKKKRGG